MCKQALISHVSARNATVFSGMCAVYALALLVGAVLPLAFAPLGWYWLAVLSPAVLFLLAARLPKRQALWASYFFGLGYFGVGVSWVFISISRYGSGPVTAMLVTVGFVALLALFPWSAVFLVRTLCPRMGGFALWLGLPAAWVLSEWARLWFLTGFPWLFLGYSQIGTPLAAIAPVFGVLGVSFVVTVMAGALAWTALCVNLRRLAITSGALVALLIGARLLDREWTEPVAKPLSIALVQGNVEQDRKWKPEALAFTLRRYRALTQPYAGIDLIVWPETAVPAWFDQDNA